jgi:hypothetical protein
VLLALTASSLPPAGAARPRPVVIWTVGSAWLADSGKNGAAIVAW